MSVSRKDSVVWGSPVKPRNFVIIGASASVTSTLVVFLLADRLMIREIATNQSCPWLISAAGVLWCQPGWWRDLWAARGD